MQADDDGEQARQTGQDRAEERRARAAVAAVLAVISEQTRPQAPGPSQPSPVLEEGVGRRLSPGRSEMTATPTSWTSAARTARDRSISDTSRLSRAVAAADAFDIWFGPKRDDGLQLRRSGIRPRCGRVRGGAQAPPSGTPARRSGIPIWSYRRRARAMSSRPAPPARGPGGDDTSASVRAATAGPAITSATGACCSTSPGCGRCRSIVTE